MRCAARSRSRGGARSRVTRSSFTRATPPKRCTSSSTAEPQCGQRRLGQRATLAILGPGDAFGELAILGSEPRRGATVVAIEPLETRSIYAADFHRLRRAHPQLSDVIIGLLTAQVQRMNSELLDALYLPAELRVRKRLADLAGQYEETGGETVIPVRQEDIADLAGTSRATVNRVLREEARRGTVRLSRGQTVVLDRARLVELVGER